MLFEFLLVIPSLFHFAFGQNPTPDPLEELFGNGLDNKVDPWSSNLLFGDPSFNEISNVLDSSPPHQNNNRRGNSQRDPLPMGLSFLNGGASLPEILAQDTNPSPMDAAPSSENGLINLPPMPNFDQLGLENVLDKFLPIDGSVHLPPPSNDPIVHSRDNVPIPSIGQLGLDTTGLFGRNLFSPDAGSLSSKPTSPSKMADPTPSSFRNDIFNANNNNNIPSKPTSSSRLADATPSSFRNDNVNTNNNNILNIPNNFQSNNQLNTLLFPTKASPTLSSPAQPTTTSPGRSEQQILLDQQIWDSIIPPLPQNRKPVEVFPQNDPTPKPKRNKKLKPLLPLLPPSPSRKSSTQSQNTKNEPIKTPSDNALNTIPSFDQLTLGAGSRSPPKTPAPSTIHSDNLIENIPSIDELGIDLFGNNLPFLDQGNSKPQNAAPTLTTAVREELPDQISNQQLPSENKDQASKSDGSTARKTTETDNNTSTLESLWNILVKEVPGISDIISGGKATTPKPKPLDIESLLGISASDIDAFDAKQGTEAPPISTSQLPLPPKLTTKSLLPDLRPTTASPKPPTTPPPVVYIQTSTTAPLPPTTIYIPPPTTQLPTTQPPPPTQPPTTHPQTTPKPAVYNLPDLPFTDIFFPFPDSQQPTETPVLPVPTLPSLEKTTSHITIDFNKNDRNTFKETDIFNNDGGELPLQLDNLLPSPDFPSFTTPSDKPRNSENKKLKTNFNSMILPDVPLTTPYPLHLIPAIPESDLKRPKFEDLGIFNNNQDPEPIIDFLAPKQDHRGVGENTRTNEKSTKEQSKVFGLDSLLGDKQTTLFDTILEPKQDNNIDFNSPYKPLTTTPKWPKGPNNELHLPELDFITNTKEENIIQSTTTTVIPPTTAPKLPLFDLSLLGDMNAGKTNQNQETPNMGEEQSKVTISSNNIKDVPPLDFDIFNTNKQSNAEITTNNDIKDVPPLDFDIFNTNKQGNAEITTRNDIKDVPPLDFDIFNTNKHGNTEMTTRNDINDMPPLDFDIFNTNNEVKTEVTTPFSVPSLPSLPSLNNLNSLKNDGGDKFEGNTFEPKKNVDPLKSIIDSGPSHADTTDNSVPISNSLRQNSELFPFVSPTSEASKHFVFQDQSQGGNMRTHPPASSLLTTPTPVIQTEEPRKPNIIVIDIQKQPLQTNRRGLQNNIASIESVSNSENIVTLHEGSRAPQQEVRHIQQVTQAPPRVTTPAWLASTILAIRDRLNQLRAMRNNGHNGNNNVQTPSLPGVVNRNQEQPINVPPGLDSNSQRNDIQQVQRFLQSQLRNRNPQNSNVNLRNNNGQQQGVNGFTPRMNIHFGGLPQNQAQQQRPNFHQVGIPQFQIPNNQNQLNQPNIQPNRRTANIPSPNLRVQPSGIQGSPTQQTEAMQNDIALVRERIRQRIQQIIRTQLLRHLLARRLQELRNSQTTNNAQANQNQPIWRAPSAANNLNVMNANNAINLIRQARQRTLTATQQQRQQQQQQQNQQNVDLSRNIFPNPNFGNTGFVPPQFRPPQPPNPRFDLSRLLQNNRGANFNNRLAQILQQMASNGTNGNRINGGQQPDLSRPPSEIALQNLRNFNQQRTHRVVQPGTSTFRPNQNLVVQRRAVPVSEAFQLIERLRAQNRDIAPFGNINSNNFLQSLVERLRNGSPNFQPVQTVPNSAFNRQRILVPLNGPLLGLRNNQNITRRPNLVQTSPPPRFTGAPNGWPWASQQNGDNK